MSRLRGLRRAGKKLSKSQRAKLRKMKREGKI
jgi:hypothetical protein